MAGLMGCPVSSSDDCEALASCTTGGTTSETTSSGGTTSLPPPECIPEKPGDAIAESCGIFVDPGQGTDGGDGTKTAPFATVGKALEVAAGAPIYVCAGETAEKSPLSIAGAAFVYGGFACGDWTYDQSKPVLKAPPGETAITIEEGASLVAWDLAIVAQTPAKEATSSIAILAKASSSLELSRADLTAGNGTNGKNGVSPSGSPGEAPAGMQGGAGCVDATPVVGGVGGTNLCGGTAVDGGLGGTGLMGASGGAGSPGQPQGNGGGEPGKAQTANICTDGADGVGGELGSSGDGAKVNENGTFTDQGFSGAPGKDGQSGGFGGGGGGGGGAKTCSSNSSAAGPSGGGGGAGGCGGMGGGGGAAGGSSFAIAAYKVASLSLHGVKINVGNGGAGGQGGQGQLGGIGGQAGNRGGPYACYGGRGGDGAPGGAGGGGRGGHAFAILYSGDNPAPAGLLDDVEIVPGIAGEGGLPGPDHVAADLGQGAPGDVGDILAL